MFTRSKYDVLAYELQKDRSVGPGDFRIFHDNNNSSNECLTIFGPHNAKNQPSDTRTFFDDFGSLADAETDITNRRNRLTRSNIYGKNQAYLKHKTFNKKICEHYIDSQDTRFTHPLDNYKGMTTYDLQLQPHLFQNPQWFVQDHSHREGTSSRLLVKDCYIEQPEGFLSDTYIKPVKKHVPKRECRMSCTQK